MLSRWSPQKSTRDTRIDWLRGLAMVCVIVDHSKRSSLLSWFSYQRFWVVTAAEVFVVLSGIVLGMVYGGRLARDGALVVTKRLMRRALVLYATFIAVTVSILGLALVGVDVSAVTAWDPNAVYWFLDPRAMTASNWRDLFLLRYGPWPFEIVGLYVCLVLVAVPCIAALGMGKWRSLLLASWGIYLCYCIAPRALTTAEFEAVFPIPAWQLLFVHGIVIGYHREAIAAFASRKPKALRLGLAGACVAFMVFALSNPAVDGPNWLRWRVFSPDTFSALYDRYFSLTDLGIGRILNLAVALPTGYAILAWQGLRKLASPFHGLLVTLGRGSLGAFVLHVYGLLVLAHLPESDQLWVNTAVQILLIVAIALVLKAIKLVPLTIPRRAVPEGSLSLALR